MNMVCKEEDSFRQTVGIFIIQTTQMLSYWLYTAEPNW